MPDFRFQGGKPFPDVQCLVQPLVGKEELFVQTSDVRFEFVSQAVHLIVEPFYLALQSRHSSFDRSQAILYHLRLGKQNRLNCLADSG